MFTFILIMETCFFRMSPSHLPHSWFITPVWGENLASLAMYFWSLALAWVPLILSILQGPNPGLRHPLSALFI